MTTRRVVAGVMSVGMVSQTEFREWRLVQRLVQWVVRCSRWCSG